MASRSLATIGFSGVNDHPLLRGLGAPLPSGPWISTVGCVEWTRVQWKARFNGIPFAVAADERTGGRRIHVHEFPGRETWLNEDLGRLRQMVEVEAYVFGDQSPLWAEMLFAACDAGGVHTLYLPMRTPLPARGISVSSKFVENALGRMDFTMRFVIETNDQHFQVPTPVKWKSWVFLAQSVSTAANAVIAKARNDFEVGFTGDQPTTGRVQAGQMINIAAARLRYASKQSRVKLLEASKIDFAIRHMQLLSVELADTQRLTSDTLTPTMLVRTQRIGRSSHLQAVAAGLKIPPNPLAGLALRTSTNQVIAAIGNADEGFGGTFLNALRLLAKGSPNPTDLVQALNILTALNTNALQTSMQASSAASIATDLELAGTVADFVRRVGIASQASATISTTPENQAGAIQTRKRLLSNIDAEVALTRGKFDICEQLRGLRRSIVDYMSYWSADGQGTKKVYGRSVRSLADVAADNYPPNSVEDRDRQIMKLNNIRHPLYAPPELTILRQ